MLIHYGEKLKKSTLADYPELVEQWNYKRNGKLSPSSLASRSHVKAWWKCKEGHEWKSNVSNRTRMKSGCPLCANVKAGLKNRQNAIDKLGSLLKNNPKLASEWHPTKNGELTPDKVAEGSNVKVWWMCKRGHEWNAVVSSRTNGRGCRQCAPKISKREIRVLCELRSVFDEMNTVKRIELPFEIDVYNDKYKFGVEIDGYPWHSEHYTKGTEKRDLNKYATAKKLGITLFRLRDKRLNRIHESDIFYQEKENEIISIKKVFSSIKAKVELDYSIIKKIEHYMESNSFMNSSEYKDIISKLPNPPPGMSLQELKPNLAEQWNKRNHPLMPENVYAKTHDMVWWICDKGHEWRAGIANRAKEIRPRGCPECYKLNIVKIATKTNREMGIKRTGKLSDRKALMKEWNYKRNKENPETIPAGSGTKFWWICGKGHEWKTTPAHRTNPNTNPTNCRICAPAKAMKVRNKRYISERGSLKDKFPSIAALWNHEKNGELKPSNVLSLTTKKIHWICENKHTWISSSNKMHQRYGRNPSRLCVMCEADPIQTLKNVKSVQYKILPSVRCLLVKELFDKHKVTKTDVSKILGVSPALITKYTNEKRSDAMFSDEFLKNKQVMEIITSLAKRLVDDKQEDGKQRRKVIIMEDSEKIFKIITD